MKKIFMITAVILLVCGFTLGAFAAEDDGIQAVVTADPNGVGITIPDAGAVEDGVVDLVDRLDKGFAGAEFWERGKAWVLANLSTIVGAVMAASTVIVGLATKFSFVPKILKKIKEFSASMGKWYDANTGEVKNLTEAFSKLKTSLQDYFAEEIKPIIDKIDQQSEENNRLIEENNYLRREFIKYRDRADKIEGALLEYSKLSAEEFYNIILQSDLTKAELDRNHDAYMTKLRLIESAHPEDGTSEGSDAA